MYSMKSSFLDYASLRVYLIHVALCAVYIFHFRNCIELLKRGVNVNLRDIDGCVPLHCAAQSGNLEVVRLLVNHHANVDAM